MKPLARPALVLLLPAALTVAAITIAVALALFTDTFSVGSNAFTTDNLDPPTSLTATGGTSVDLSWTATVDTYASGHRVLRGTASGGPYTQIAEVTPRTTTTYTDNPADGTYYYVVRAFYQNWESANSNEASATVAPTVSFVSVADSYADENSPTENFGTAASMYVRSENAVNRRSFAQFDISSIPAGSTINSANLTLCTIEVPTPAVTYEVHRVTAAWGETTITWNNQPTVAATATASATTPASGCMSWTVTSDVAAWVAGTANNGWRIKDQTENSPAPASPQTEFHTRESGSVTERPTLGVTYTPP